MKNFIVVHTRLATPVVLRWGNNEQELTHDRWMPYMEICINDCASKNQFWIINSGNEEYEIEDVTMYGFGQGKIKFWARFHPDNTDASWCSHIIHASGKWVLDWQYPTFTWLHHSLGKGWLVKPAN